MYYVKNRSRGVCLVESETRNGALEAIKTLESADVMGGSFEPYSYSIIKKDGGVEYGEEVIP